MLTVDIHVHVQAFHGYIRGLSSVLSTSASCNPVNKSSTSVPPPLRADTITVVEVMIILMIIWIHVKIMTVRHDKVSPC